MTRDIAIEVLTDLQDGSAGECWLAETIADAIDRKIEDLHDALDMAIKALERECADEWCTDCKEYDTEKKCCPRFNRVIRGAMKREPSEDLISRTEAIEAIEIVDWYHQNSNKDMVHGANDDEHQAWYKAQDIYKALEAVPSADRPRGEWIHSPNGIDRDFVWWVCSECGHKIFSETEKDRIEFHAYCGRCGAYMRGDMK